MGGWKHRISDIDEESKTGTCAHCGPNTPMRRANGRSLGWRCRNAYLEHKGPTYRTRGRQLLGRNYEAVLAKQKGLCAICRAEMDPPHADHCHETDKFRGLLCRNCNLGLGFFKDDPAKLRSALRYLRRHAEPSRNDLDRDS